MTFFCTEHLRPVIPALSAWYRANRKLLPWREDRNPYHIWVSEIMLQQTRIEAVIPYYRRFLENLPDISALAGCEDDLLMKLWEGLGYYSRVRNLRAAARKIMDEYGGEMPHSAAELRTLPGIGDYTAGAIASIAFGEPEPAVDGNVLRVIMRLTGAEYDIALPVTKKLVTHLLRDIYPVGEEAGEVTEGLMELGETVCIPNGEPRCRECPVKNICVANREQTWNRIPVKSAKKDRKTVDMTVLLLTSHDKIAIEKRPEKGLLAGLWQFPNLEGHLNEQQLRKVLAGRGIQAGEILPCGNATHIFTHLTWNMTGYRITCDTTIPDYLWIKKSELESQYALPSAFRYYRSVFFQER